MESAKRSEQEMRPGLENRERERARRVEVIVDNGSGVVPPGGTLSFSFPKLLLREHKRQNVVNVPIPAG